MKGHENMRIEGHLCGAAWERVPCKQVNEMNREAGIQQQRRMKQKWAINRDQCLQSVQENFRADVLVVDGI